MIVKYVEGELQHERLVLAVVDDSSAALLASCSIPLQNIAPGHYYNVKVPLVSAKGQDVDNDESEEAGSHIFVTICLTSAPAQELDRWNRRQDKAMGVVQLRLASCSITTHSSDVDDEFMGIFARVQLKDSEDDSDEDSDPGSDVEPLEFDDIYMELPGSSSKDNTVLQEVTLEWNMGGDAIVPVLGRSANKQLWPVSRMVLLALASGSREDKDIVLSLHAVSEHEDSTVLGQCSLPVRSLPDNGDGALVPYRGLSLKGGDGVTLVLPVLQCTMGPKPRLYTTVLVPQRVETPPWR